VTNLGILTVPPSTLAIALLVAWRLGDGLPVQLVAVVVAVAVAWGVIRLLQWLEYGEVGE
jgi:hypothetical protein